MLNTLKRFKARTLVIAAVAMAMVFGLGVGTAYAVVTSSTAGITEKQYFVRDDAPFTVTAAAGVWQNIPSMVRTVTVPAGTSRMLDARFTAESHCTGGSWCAVRVVYVNTTTGATVEFYPQTGTNYAFDSPSTDQWEGHALERSTPFLGAGTYRVQVQAAEVGAGSSFSLDDMHFVVEAIRP